MHDTIQEDLAAYQAGDRAAGERALSALMREWRPIVRRLLRNPGAEEVDEYLQAMLARLAVPRSPGGPIPALAPEHAGSPRGWRSRVLKNAMIDRFRREGRRRHQHQALLRGDTLDMEKASWRQQRRSRQDDGPPPTLTDPLSPQAAARSEAAPPLFGESVEMRESALALVERLVIRRRVIVMLALRANPVAHAEELATELGEAQADTEARMAAALVSWPDGTHKWLTMPMVRVPWPHGPDSKARESARRNLERAVVDLTGMLGEEP